MHRHSCGAVRDNKTEKEREEHEGRISRRTCQCLSVGSSVLLPTNVLLQFAAFCLTQGNIISAFFISMSWKIVGNTTNSFGKRKQLKIKQITQLY